MSLSRRKFTQEFKLSAVERLEQGASAAEVSRAFEINPNLLHRWRREFRQGPGNAFPGANTIERYRQLADHHIIPCLGTIPLSKLRPLGIQEFYED